MKDVEDLQQKIISLCKRRGFVYPGSEIYGGLANTYDYGPLGSLMMRNIQNLWWENFITKRSDMYGLDTAILMAPEVWSVRIVLKMELKYPWKQPYICNPYLTGN